MATSISVTDLDDQDFDIYTTQIGEFNQYLALDHAAPGGDPRVGQRQFEHRGQPAGRGRAVCTALIGQAPANERA